MQKTSLDTLLRRGASKEFGQPVAPPAPRVAVAPRPRGRAQRLQVRNGEQGRRAVAPHWKGQNTLGATVASAPAACGPGGAGWSGLSRPPRPGPGPTTPVVINNDNTAQAPAPTPLNLVARASQETLTERRIGPR